MRVYRVAFVPDAGVDPILHILADEVSREQALIAARDYAEGQFRDEEWDNEYYGEHVVSTRAKLADFERDGAQQIMMVPYGVVVIV